MWTHYVQLSRDYYCFKQVGVILRGSMIENTEKRVILTDVVLTAEYK